MTELRLENVSISYNIGEPNEVQVLRRCSLRVLSGMPLIVNGENGSGKSTLLKAIAGKISPASGAIRVLTSDSSGIDDQHWLRENVDYVPQLPIEALVPDLTLAEHLALYAKHRSSIFDPYMQSKRFAVEESRLSQFMGRYGIYKHRRVMDLSGGEQQLFALALAQYRSFPIILLDEPTAALDKEKVREVEAKLRTWLQAADVISVIVTHDQSFADRLGFRSITIGSCCSLEA